MDAQPPAGGAPAATRVFALAASSGGLEALRLVLAGLAHDFPAPILILLHLSPNFESRLPEILASHSKADVRWASAGDRLTPGTIYVAPRQQHLLVEPGDILALSDMPRMNFVRPAADLLFASLASACRERAVAVVLTGRGTDGRHGAQQVKANGGIVIAQDERSSTSFGMPGAATDAGIVDFVLPLDMIAGKLNELATAGNHES